MEITLWLVYSRLGQGTILIRTAHRTWTLESTTWAPVPTQRPFTADRPGQQDSTR